MTTRDKVILAIAVPTLAPVAAATGIALAFALLWLCVRAAILVESLAGVVL